MKKQIELTKTMKVEDPKMLPYAIYLSMFFGTRILYKGKLLSSRIKLNTKGRLIRAIEVGSCIYIEQEKYGNNTIWAKKAREGHQILWVVHKPTKRVVGKVVNGHVSKL